MRGDIKRLIINIPPRSLKSISVSVALPAYLLAHNPSEQIVVASYADKLALKHSVDTRLILNQPWYKTLYPDVVLAADQNEKGKFQTTARGHRIATSVGGSVIGEGGNFLIVDDPLNPMQALSDSMRTNANTWFDQSFSTRLNNKKTGVIVVVMQRLHEDDLTGHLLAKGGWEHLCLPSIAEKKTIVEIGNFRKVREEGELLHPEREGKKELDAIRRELGEYGFAGQMQQRPVPLGGGMLKVSWFKRYREKPEGFIRIVQSWDTAMKAGDHNDPSCCTTWGVTETGYYLMDVYCERLEYPALKRAAASLYEKWLPDAVLIEDKASGQSLIQDLRNETRLPVLAVNPIGDKITRASSSSALIESGRCYLPESAPWLAGFESELMHFPNGTHDDQVDSTSQFLNWINKQQTGGAPKVRKL